MQKPNRPLRVNKLPHVLQRRIGQAIEIFRISGLPIDMVPCLHQCNVYVVRKLQVWRAQKFNFVVSAKSTPTGTGQQTAPCLAALYWASNRKFSNFGSTYRHGSVLAPMQHYVKRKLQVWSSQKCNFLVSAKTAPTGTGQHTTPCLAAPYLVSNRNFQNFGATYRHGSVLAQMQYLY